MWPIIKKNGIEFVLFLLISSIFDGFGMKKWVSFVLTVLVSIIVKKIYVYFKGHDPDIDERVKVNSEKAALATLSYITILLGIVYFILDFNSFQNTQYVLYAILILVGSFFSFLMIFMRKN